MSLPPRLLPTIPGTNAGGNYPGVAVESVRRTIAPDQRVVAAAGVVTHGLGIAKKLVVQKKGVSYRTSADQRVVAAAAIAIHGPGIAMDEVVRERRVPAGQGVVAATGVVVHRLGVAIDEVDATSAADYRVIAAAAVAIDNTGVAIET